MKRCVQFSKSAFNFSLVSVDEAYVSPDFILAILLFQLMKVRSVDLKKKKITFLFCFS